MFFRKHNPDKDVQALLAKYAGNEEKLLASVREKFGVVDPDGAQEPDGATAEEIKALEKLKASAVAAENFDEAKRLKAQIESIQAGEGGADGGDLTEGKAGSIEEQVRQFYELHNPDKLDKLPGMSLCRPPVARRHAHPIQGAYAAGTQRIRRERVIGTEFCGAQAFCSATKERRRSCWQT